MNRKILAVVLIVVVGIIGGIFGLKKMQKESELVTPTPELPKSGEGVYLRVFASNLNSEPTANVKITVTDENRSKTWENVTNENGSAGFPFIMGNTYTIKASFHNSTESLTSTIGPRDRVYVDVENQSVTAVRIIKVLTA